MIPYLLRALICAALLWGVYQLFLRKEKMHRFNRFYLLFSMAFSFGIPFLTLETPAPAMPVTEMMELFIPANDPPASIPLVQAPAPVPEQSLWPLLLLAGYSCITAFLLYRYIKNIVVLGRLASRSPSASYAGIRVVLVPARIIPFSFLNRIFVTREEFENAAIEKEILLHECTHVRQRHSIDILLVELLLVFAWFIPALYLYRKAIRLNHEFLADAAVVDTYHNAPAYQYLLLGKAGQPSSLLFTHSFTYSITKKRLIMMTQKTSAGLALIKQGILVPAVLALCAFIFSTRTVAQNTPPVVNEPVRVAPSPEHLADTTRPPSWMGLSPGSTKEGVSQELLNEYDQIVHQYRTTGKSWWQEFQKTITETDKARLEAIFIQMNPAQQEKQMVAFIAPAGPLPKIVPTQALLESFKNATQYGVWINNKKVANSTLNNYSHTDFSQVFISRLYGAAKRSYTFQVDLMTNDHYQQYYQQTIANKKNQMVFRFYKKQEEIQ